MSHETAQADQTSMGKTVAFNITNTPYTYPYP